MQRMFSLREDEEDGEIAEERNLSSLSSLPEKGLPHDVLQGDPSFKMTAIWNQKVETERGFMMERSKVSSVGGRNPTTTLGRNVSKKVQLSCHIVFTCVC
jgi:hypothetical protein